MEIYTHFSAVIEQTLDSQQVFDKESPGTGQILSLTELIVLGFEKVLMIRLALIDLIAAVCTI